MPPSRNVVRNDINDPGLGDGTATAILCPFCQNVFPPIRHQRYCTPACRQVTGHGVPVTVPAPVVVLSPRTWRREITIYECVGCATRSLGQRWLPGLQPACAAHRLRRPMPTLPVDRPVAISDLTDRHPNPRTSR